MDMLALVPLLWMIRSDWKERMVNLWLLALFGGCVWGATGMELGWQACLYRTMVNGSVMLGLGGAVCLYFLLRYRCTVSSLRRYFGKGDVVFLCCLMPAFGGIGYVRFLVISFSFSVVVYWCIPVRKSGQQGIPLVSTVGISYVFYVLYCFIFSR